MPRGIPNVKRDETQGMRYTTFTVPLQLNLKHMSSSYLKSDSQTIWARNAVRQKAARDATPLEGRRGSNVIVIHPGSRFLRIGRASDITPTTVPSCIARKTASPVPASIYIENITRPRKSVVKHHPPAGDEYAVAPASDDPFDERVSSIRLSLRDRMRFYKLRVTPDAANKAFMFNVQSRPEIIPEENDMFRVKFIQEPPADDYLVGEKVLLLSDPQKLGFAVRYPIVSSRFNTRDYPSTQMILDDIETIIATTLQEKLGIEPKFFKDYSVVLIIPDFYEKTFVSNLVQILLDSMGFKQLCAQQESLAATYGAGLSTACVVNMGATCTSIACVDEGMVLPDTRLYLNMGGDAITEFLYVLLSRINLPYRDIDLSRSYDWAVMEELKAKVCTLIESDVALNLYDFVVRAPGRPTEKYGLRAYDEVILAPMCLFEPRVIDFDRRRRGMRPLQHPDVTDEVYDHRENRDSVGHDQHSQAMIISTQHLLVRQASEQQPLEPIDVAPSATDTDPATTATTADPSPVPVSGDTSAEPSDTPMDASAAPSPKPESAPSASTEMDVDVVGETKPAPSTSTSTSTALPSPPKTATPAIRHDIDIAFEASKLPLDVAIFNSTRAGGGHDKIRKYLQSVLVVGGTALVPGMSHALESRLQAIATPLVVNMEKVQIVPPPKDVDPRVLIWKGGSVLGKMDGVADLWLTPSDWDMLGIRGLRERCFFL
ncbi:hypothetical protein K488DRAFT_78343 [Vararia minispora EC-137]|uniref:Uncharacterized protein n=1 Tax=Vararia minispora EC-137 TaxID=1314806 RepID=A0ACB8QLW9_9AGAM|nr:hypothetical protein K488DRAFT_78343 [Vararia minispora EC-137]